MKKRTIKRRLSVMLIFSMVMSLFAGCWAVDKGVRGVKGTGSLTLEITIIFE